MSSYQSQVNRTWRRELREALKSAGSKLKVPTTLSAAAARLSLDKLQLMRKGPAAGGVELSGGRR